jgi:short-subunit dehydrogenase
VPTEFQQVAGYSLDPLRRTLAVDADQVAREGLAALERGERVWVPGLRMRLASSAMRLLPPGLAGRLTSPRRGR